ncbi:MAG: hypothetical protein AB1716_07720 [Planctomycetota bacterium]
MTTAQLERRLTGLCPPRIEPGPHRDACRARLLAPRGATKQERRRRYGRVLLLGIAGAGVLAAGAMFVARGRIVRMAGLRSAPMQADSFVDVDARYREEVRRLWENGGAELIDRTQTDYLTRYDVRFRLHDGTTLVRRMGQPPDPAKRREIAALIAAGQGRVVGTRHLDGGSLLYVSEYTLSDGELFRQSDPMPPLSEAARQAAQEFVRQQHAARQGRVLHVSPEGNRLVEYRLPDGRPITVGEAPPGPEQTPPSPELTPEREAEIFAMKCRGEGRLISQGFTPAGSGYSVEYTLADGTKFVIGMERPVMSDADWARARTAAQALWARGQYERGTVTGLDGEQVPVIRMTLPGGYQAVIVDSPTERQQVWGLP